MFDDPCLFTCVPYETVYNISRSFTDVISVTTFLAGYGDILTTSFFTDNAISKRNY